MLGRSTVSYLWQSEDPDIQFISRSFVFQICIAPSGQGPCQWSRHYMLHWVCIRCIPVRSTPLSACPVYARGLPAATGRL